MQMIHIFASNIKINSFCLLQTIRLLYVFLFARSFICFKSTTRTVFSIKTTAACAKRIKFSHLEIVTLNNFCINYIIFNAHTTHHCIKLSSHRCTSTNNDTQLIEPTLTDTHVHSMCIVNFLGALQFADLKCNTSSCSCSGSVINCFRAFTWCGMITNFSFIKLIYGCTKIVKYRIVAHVCELAKHKSVRVRMQ